MIESSPSVSLQVCYLRKPYCIPGRTQETGRDTECAWHSRDELGLFTGRVGCGKLRCRNNRIRILVRML